MKLGQLFPIFASKLIPFTVANAFGALIPVFIVEEIGAGDRAVGIYFSIAFVSIFCGVMTAGWLSDRFQLRKPLMWLSAFNIPIILMMGNAPNIVILTVLIVFFEFILGMGDSAATIIAGIVSDEQDRGTSFVMAWLPLSLGALLGGGLSAFLVENGGFNTFFMGLAFLYTLQLLIIVYVSDVKDSAVPQGDIMNEAPVQTGAVFGRGFIWLFLASNLVYITPYIGLIARPSVMNTMGFSDAAIASTVGFSGAFSLPLTIIIGLLVNRMRRVPLLVACYVMNLAGMILLLMATSLWQFQLSAGLLLGINVSLVAGSAFVTDTTPPLLLGRVLALYSGTAWIGGILGSGLAGVAVEAVGASRTFLLGAFLPAFALALMIPIWFTETVDKRVKTPME